MRAWNGLLIGVGCIVCLAAFYKLTLSDPFAPSKTTKLRSSPSAWTTTIFNADGSVRTNFYSTRRPSVGNGGVVLYTTNDVRVQIQSPTLQIDPVFEP